MDWITIWIYIQANTALLQVHISIVISNGMISTNPVHATHHLPRDSHSCVIKRGTPPDFISADLLQWEKNGEELTSEKFN